MIPERVRPIIEECRPVAERFVEAGHRLYLVGGIVRDILAMGARPIAVMDPLRFGDAAHPDTKRVLPGVVAGVGVPGVMFLLSEIFRLLRGKVGMGMGDVKLAISIGLVVGYLGGLELVVFAYGSVTSAVVIAVVLMLAGKAKLASRIPFGPYLAIGAMLPIVAFTTLLVVRLSAYERSAVERDLVETATALATRARSSLRRSAMTVS